MNALQKFSLEGKVALVTGGSRGLGRAMAEALGDAGASVAVTARTLAAAEAAASELSELGIRAYGVQLEVSDVDDVERAVEQVSTEFGEIDVLLNNAGIGVAGRAFETPDTAWHEVFSVNVDGLWYCSRAVARRMAERGGGTIVNVGSMSAEIVNQPRHYNGEGFVETGFPPHCFRAVHTTDISVFTDMLVHSNVRAKA